MTMKSLLTFAMTTAALTVSQQASADVIRCSFTEPFLSTEYSMAQQSLTIIDPVNAHPKVQTEVIKNVSFQIKGPGVFELQDRNGKVIQKLTLNNQGSDGMSDIVYPYEVAWSNASIKDLPSSGNGRIEFGNLYGGCESNFLKRVEPK